MQALPRVSRVWGREVELGHTDYLTILYIFDSYITFPSYSFLLGSWGSTLKLLLESLNEFWRKKEINTGLLEVCVSVFLCVCMRERKDTKVFCQKISHSEMEDDFLSQK